MTRARFVPLLGVVLALMVALLNVYAITRATSHTWAWVHVAAAVLGTVIAVVLSREVER